MFVGSDQTVGLESQACHKTKAVSLDRVCEYPSHRMRLGFHCLGSAESDDDWISNVRRLARTLRERPLDRIG